MYNSERCEKKKRKRKLGNYDYACRKIIHVERLINSKPFPLFNNIKQIERVHIHIFNDHYVLINTCDESRFQKRNRPTRLSTLM